MFDGLTDDQLRSAAPAIFATHAGPDCSDRYAYLPSYNVVRDLRTMGLVPVNVRTGKKKNPQGVAFAIHEIMFRPKGFYARAPELGELTPQISLLNSHDRTSPMAFDAGMERAVCTNGMRTNDVALGGFKVRHTGKNRIDEVHAGMKVLLAGIDRMVEVANDWNKIHLSNLQEDLFCDRAVKLRGTALDIAPKALLVARRPQDEGDSLWKVFNRVQENIMKGGVTGTNAKGKDASLRKISTLAADVDFNRKLWTAASELAAEVKSQRISTAALA